MPPAIRGLQRSYMISSERVGSLRYNRAGSGVMGDRSAGCLSCAPAPAPPPVRAAQGTSTLVAANLCPPGQLTCSCHTRISHSSRPLGEFGTRLQSTWGTPARKQGCFTLQRPWWQNNQLPNLRILTRMGRRVLARMQAQGPCRAHHNAGENEGGGGEAQDGVNHSQGHQCRHAHR